MAWLFTTRRFVFHASMHGRMTVQLVINHHECDLAPEINKARFSQYFDSVSLYVHIQFDGVEAFRDRARRSAMMGGQSAPEFEFNTTLNFYEESIIYETCASRSLFQDISSILLGVRSNNREFWVSGSLCDIYSLANGEVATRDLFDGRKLIGTTVYAAHDLALSFDQRLIQTE